MLIDAKGAGLQDEYQVSPVLVRFAYWIPNGSPPEIIHHDGSCWDREGYMPTTYDTDVGLVWYRRWA